MPFLLLWQRAAPATPPPATPATVFAGDSMMAPVHLKGGSLREYRQSLADEDAVIAATLALLGGQEP
jgi:hypothetical protein